MSVNSDIFSDNCDGTNVECTKFWTNEEYIKFCNNKNNKNIINYNKINNNNSSFVSD